MGAVFLFFRFSSKGDQGQEKIYPAKEMKPAIIRDNSVKIGSCGWTRPVIR